MVALHSSDLNRCRGSPPTAQHKLQRYFEPAPETSVVLASSPGIDRRDAGSARRWDRLWASGPDRPPHNVLFRFLRNRPQTTAIDLNCECNRDCHNLTIWDPHRVTQPSRWTPPSDSHVESWGFVCVAAERHAIGSARTPVCNKIPENQFIRITLAVVVTIP